VLVYPVFGRRQPTERARGPVDSSVGCVRIPSGEHQLLFRWQPESDRFEQVRPLPDPEGLAPYVELIERLVTDGEADTRAVRARVVEFYQRG